VGGITTTGTISGSRIQWAEVFMQVVSLHGWRLLSAGGCQYRICYIPHLQVSSIGGVDTSVPFTGSAIIVQAG